MRTFTFGFVAAAVLLCLSTGSAHADAVNNGGGIAEQNFAFAYLNMEKFYQLCDNVIEVCKLTDKERNILVYNWQRMDEERKAQPDLFFKSEKENPGFFFVDGNVRIGKTGNAVGTPIYINRDLIYPVNAQGEVQPMDIGAAVAVLTHELGHHAEAALLPFMTHEELDVLGAKVRSAVAARSERLVFGNGGSLTIGAALRPSVTALNYGDGFELTDLLVGDSETLTNISNDVLPLVTCTKAGEKARQFFLNNLHWEKWKLGENQLDLTMRASALLWCSKDGDIGYTAEQNLWLEVGLRFKWGQDAQKNATLTRDKTFLTVKTIPQD